MYFIYPEVNDTYWKCQVSIKLIAEIWNNIRNERLHLKTKRTTLASVMLHMHPSKFFLTSSTSLAPSTLGPHILLPSPSQSVAANSHCCPLHPSNCLFHRQHMLDPHSPMLALQLTILLVQNNFVDFYQLSITCVLGPQQCSSWPIPGVSMMAVQL